MNIIRKPYVYDDGKYAYLKAKNDISADMSAACLAASKVIQKVFGILPTIIHMLSG